MTGTARPAYSTSDAEYASHAARLQIRPHDGYPLIRSGRTSAGTRCNPPKAGTAFCALQPPSPALGRDLRSPDCDDITTATTTDLTTARIRHRRVLGGLIHEYERAA